MMDTLTNRDSCEDHRFREHCHYARTRRGAMLSQGEWHWEQGPGVGKSGTDHGEKLRLHQWLVAPVGEVRSKINYILHARHTHTSTKKDETVGRSRLFLGNC